MEALALMKFFKAANCISFTFHGHRAFAVWLGRTGKKEDVCGCGGGVALPNRGHVKLMGICVSVCVAFIHCDSSRSWGLYVCESPDFGASSVS